MNGKDKTIGTRDLLRVLGRSLFIQASWSYERMQALGFAYALEPLLRKLYPDQAEYEARLRLHMEYFNTQPYLASFILGAAARLEQERASGRNPSTDVQALKITLMGPLGALGDSFFWGALRPLAAVTATAALLVTGAWWAPVLFLIVFNSWHLGLRAAVLFWGYENSGDAVDLMTRYRFTKAAKSFKAASLCVVGGIAGLLPAWLPAFKPEMNVVNMSGLFLSMAGLAITILLIAILRKGISPIQLMLGLAVLCLALAYTGVI